MQCVLQSSELKKDRNNKAEKRLKKLEKTIFFIEITSQFQKKVEKLQPLVSDNFLVFDKFPLSQNYVGRRPLSRKQKKCNRKFLSLSD